MVDSGPPRGLRAAPGVRVLFRPVLWRVVAAVTVVCAVLVTGIVWRPDLLHPTSPTGDPWNYLAAAERLRDGHPLYGIGPGDRPVFGYPTLFPLPLLAPPTMAIVWVPLLALPADAAMTLWAAGGFVAVTATVAWMIVRGGIGVQILVTILSIPIAKTALSGNVNAYLLPILTASWLGLSSRVGLVGGLTTGFATVVRVGPALIGLLYVVRRRWLAAIVAVGTVCVIGALSVLVAGANAWMTYMRTSLGGAIQPTALSVPGLLVAQGVDTGVAHYAIVGVWIVAGIAIVVLRARPRIAFVVAVVASIYATPVVRMEFWALLLAGAAPWVLHGPSDAEGLVADAAIGGS